MGLFSKLERAFGLKESKRRKRRESERKHKTHARGKRRARKANGEFKKRGR